MNKVTRIVGATVVAAATAFAAVSPALADSDNPQHYYSKHGYPPYVQAPGYRPGWHGGYRGYNGHPYYRGGYAGYPGYGYPGYGYGYDPGAAVAAGVIGGVFGALAGAAISHSHHY